MGYKGSKKSTKSNPVTNLLSNVATALQPLTKSVKRQNQNTSQKRTSGNRNYMLNHVSISDSSLLKSVHQMSSSYFFPQNGIFRGQAKAFEESALATLKGTTIAANSTSANNIFAFAFSPATCNTPGWLSYGFGTTIATAIASNPVTQIIGNSQAESYRVVGACLTVTPQGSFTNQAGSGLTGYVSDPMNFAQTPANIANLRIQRPFKGVDTQIMHWLPSENSILDESQFLSIASTAVFGSFYIGYINIPVSSDMLTSFQLDYTVGIEYIPSPAYRPFVDLCPPYQDIRAQQFVNMIARQSWDPLMLARIEDYEKAVILHDVLDGGRRQSYQLGTDSYASNRHAEAGYIEDIAQSNNSQFLNGARNAIINTGKDLATRFVNQHLLNPINEAIPGTMFDLPLMAIAA